MLMRDGIAASVDFELKICLLRMYHRFGFASFDGPVARMSFGPQLLEFLSVSVSFGFTEPPPRFFVLSLLLMCLVCSLRK